MMISAILLAAGEAIRMGKPKQLLPFGKSTVLEQAIDNLLGSQVDEIVVVVGHRAEEIAHQAQYREQFDMVLSRAVASLPTLVELTLPFCTIGGSFISQKKGLVFAISDPTKPDYTEKESSDRGGET